MSKPLGDELMEEIFGSRRDERPPPPKIKIMPPPPGAPPPPAILLAAPDTTIRKPSLRSVPPSQRKTAPQRPRIDPARARSVIGQLLSQLVTTQSQTPGLEQIENRYDGSGSFTDEVHDYLNRKEIAGIGPQGEILDEFEQFIRLREGERDKLHETIPFVRSGPRSAAGAWLGNTVVIAANNQPTTVVYWTGDDVDTQPVTITLSTVNNLTDTSPSAVFRPYARIGFGTRGVRALVEVDVSFGTQFVLSGSQVTVEVAAEDTSALSATQGTLRMSGHLSFRQSFKANASTRTRYADGVGPGVSWSMFGNQSSTVKGLAIPPFAKDLNVYRTGNLTDGFTIQFVDSNNVNSSQQIVAASTLMTQMDVPGDAAGLILTNNSGANTNSYKLVFDLSM